MIRGLLLLTLMLPATALAKEPIQHVLSEAEVKKAILLSRAHCRYRNIPAQAGSRSFALASGARLARPI